MVYSPNRISGSGAPQKPDPAGFRAFTEKIAQLVAGLGQTLFPSADETLARPEELLRGNPLRPDPEEPAAVESGGSTSVRTESTIDGKRDLLRELRQEGDSDDVKDVGPKIGDLDDDDVVKLIEEGKYADALDLIRDKREAETEEAEDDGKPAGEGDVSSAKGSGDGTDGETTPIGDDKGAPEDEKSE